MTAQPAKLALEDGTVFSGTAFGAIGEVDGEVVFNTSMTGYQEILTDPSYRGQIVTMTYTEIGNYGVNDEDVESDRPKLAGFLVRRIRTQGAMKGILSSVDLDDRNLVDKARRSPGLVGRDLVREVLPDGVRQWDAGLSRWARLCDTRASGPAAARSVHVVALDFGMKWNIARHLVDEGCRVTIMPGTATVQDVLNMQPDGVFLSNGPGDPEPVGYAIETIRGLLGNVPMFGICLGHQLLALACGARTFKLKFGHRGANQPVLNLESGRVEITAQNHGFAVEEATLPEQLIITHRNLNDQTIAGLRHRDLPAFSVQYHPEASAGPHDSRYLFSQFRRLMESAG